MSNPAKQPKTAARKAKKNKKQNHSEQQARKSGAPNDSQNKPRGLDAKDRVLIAGVLGLIFGELFWDNLAATIIAGALSAGLVMAAQMLVRKVLAQKEAAARANGITTAVNPAAENTIGSQNDMQPATDNSGSPADIQPTTAAEPQPAANEVPPAADSSKLS